MFLPSAGEYSYHFHFLSCLYMTQLCSSDFTVGKFFSIMLTKEFSFRFE
jgi:hypothetical protein